MMGGKVPTTCVLKRFPRTCNTMFLLIYHGPETSTAKWPYGKIKMLLIKKYRETDTEGELAVAAPTSC